MTTTRRSTAEPGVPFIDMTREFDAPRDAAVPGLHRSGARSSSGSARAGYEMVIDEYDVRDGGR